MVSKTLDTHEAVTRLKDAGAPEPLASVSYEVPEIPGTNIGVIKGEPPEHIGRELHRIARSIDGSDYPVFALTYERMGEHPVAECYNVLTGMARVVGIGPFKGHIVLRQWGCEPDDAPHYRAVLLHEYAHLYANRRGVKGHCAEFYRILYGFAGRHVGRMSLVEQWRRECRHGDIDARVTASEVAAEMGLERARKSLVQRRKRERRKARAA